MPGRERRHAVADTPRIPKAQDGEIYHFWGTELQGNHVDTVWPYWNIMDFTPEGRPDRMVPPQKFRSEFLEKHFLNK